MNTTQLGIITLLKSAILQQPQQLLEEFNIESALPVIQNHSIFPLAYEGAIQCGISRQDPVMRQMFAAYCKAMMVSEYQMRDIAGIFEAFDREGIDYMPLKGCRMKHLYPRPELRPMGDADILIRTEQYDRIRKILESLGFEEKEETDHELVWRSKGLYLELHKRLIPSYNKDFYAYYGDGWKLAKNQTGTCFSMSPEDEWIYLFTHFAKHYRDGGIGLRHVTDLWVWRRTHPEMDEEYIEGVLKELQLDVFHGNMMRLLTMWFENGETDPVLEIITEFVFSSGSFGVDEIRVLSRAVRDAKHVVPGMKGRGLYLWQTAFPSVEVLRGKYTVLKKRPWLLPAVWAIRPFYKVVFETKTLKKNKSHLRALSEENMNLRMETLNLVGLDYHF